MKLTNITMNGSEGVDISKSQKYHFTISYKMSSWKCYRISVYMITILLICFCSEECFLSLIDLTRYNWNRRSYNEYHIKFSHLVRIKNCANNFKISKLNVFEIGWLWLDIRTTCGPMPITPSPLNSSQLLKFWSFS